MAWTLGELAERISAELHGDADCLIQRVATLSGAGQGDITFLSNSRYRKYLPDTAASAVILTRDELDVCPVNALVTDNPYLGYARIATLLYARQPGEGGIAQSAVVHSTAEIDASSVIGPGAVIGVACRVGAGTVVNAGVVLGDNVTVGSDCLLYPNVVLCEGVTIGNNVILHPGVVIGSDGFGIANDKGTWLKIPQVGSVLIGNDVEIGANSTVDRGAIENTVIEDGVKIDNQVQIGHNVVIGENTAIAGCAGISGSSRIGKRCMIGGAAGIGGHLEICDDVIITGFAMVTKSVRTPGMHSSGIPLAENRRWRRNVARFQHLDELHKRVEELEKKLQDS